MAVPPTYDGARRARHWFCVLVLAAVAAMGTLGRMVTAGPAPAVGVAFLLSALVLVASVVQATRIWVALDGPPRMRRRKRRADS